MIPNPTSVSSKRPSSSTLRRPSAFRLQPLLATLTLALLVAACATANPAARTTDAQLLAPPADPCVLAREDAALNPRLDVERVPAPIKMEPAPIRRPVPRNVLRRDGSSVIKVEVMVDTLGKPDMATFTVIESSNVWFTNGAKAAIAKWTFEPAIKNGCKVARYYQFAASSAPRARR